jgi:aldose 1-epimerase
MRDGPRLLATGAGHLEVEVLPEVGARLHRLRAFGHDLLRTPDDPSTHLRDPFRWGAYVMAPWCNRIDANPTRIDGEVVDVASNFEDGTAIHGQVYARPWQVRPDGSLWVQDGGDGWPWRYESTLRITILGAALQIEQSLANLAATPMPAGLGLHPWFRRPLDVRIDAARVLRSNTDPGAGVGPVVGSLDLRAMRPMPDDLDAAWLDLGDPAVELRWPELGITATLRARSDAGLVIVGASPAVLDAVAIEPQTHLPQGLRRFQADEPLGLVALAPQATMRLTTELAFRRFEG